MVIYTVMRYTPDDKIIPLRSFETYNEAEGFAILQTKYLNEDYTYKIAAWGLHEAHVTPVIDRRLRLIK